MSGPPFFPDSFCSALAGQSVSTVARNGTWSAQLDPPPAGRVLLDLPVNQERTELTAAEAIERFLPVQEN